ncbi:hypothetical protein TNCV_200621 [Trichonephila clavipes]|nr:hypothetical protein TNCV_200621 [Trichonephila clavipes]
MSLRTLYAYISSSKDVVVRCPLCFESMTFGHYYHKHALQEHFLKNRRVRFLHGIEILASWATNEARECEACSGMLERLCGS